MIEMFEFTTAVVGIFISFAMYTTLYGKPNPLRSWAEFSYLACGTAISVVVALWYIYRTAIIPIQAGDLILIAGVILGIMMLFRLHPHYTYVSRVPLAFTVGVQLALSLRTIIFTDFLTAINATIVKLWTGIPLDFIYRFTIAVSVLTMLTFFLYTTKITGPLHWSASLGEYLMYIGFGSIFAQTFMGRLGLFVGYMGKCTTPPWKIPYTIGSAIICFILAVIFDKTGLGEKLSAI
jgi:hypothetical protein